MKKILTLMVLLATMPALALTLTSCDLILDIIQILLSGGEDAFYAKDLQTGKDYKVAAEPFTNGGDKPYGTFCKIYQEKNCKGKLNDTNLKRLADEYDNKIYTMLVEKFCMANPTYEGEPFDNMLKFASWAVGGDGRLTILLLDIRDGWNGGGYVAGYFWGGNFLNTTGSNGKDMIYIDTYPALAPELRSTPTDVPTLLTGAYSTLAHEGQHLVNFITSLYLLIKATDDSSERILMDTWIDEGLSSQAEYFYQVKANINDDQKNNNISRCEGFNADEYGTIEKGNNFFVWGNYPGNSVLDEYATVYLFNRWLYLQAQASSTYTGDKTQIFMKVMEAKDYGDQRAIVDVAKMINPAWSSWDKLLGTWMAANYYPANTNYGYIGDDYLIKGTNSRKDKDGNPTFTGVKARAIGVSSTKLAPGEGVYSKLTSTFNTSGGTQGTHIKYAGIKNQTNSAVVFDNASYTSSDADILITFNTDTTKTAIEAAANKGNETGETGRLTGGQADSKPRTSVTQGRAVGRSDPYPIDARELLERNREKMLLQTGLLTEFKANIGTVQVQVEVELDEEQ